MQPSDPATAYTGRARANATRRVLLLGARGRLGAEIAARCETAATVLSAPAREALALDASDLARCVDRWFERWGPETVVNCIALGDVDRCEVEPALAWQVNAALPAALAGSCARTGARLIHFSSDFVFDGMLRRPYREADAARPLSVYGATKLAGERAIAEVGCRHWTFRVSWLYGARSRNLTADLLDPAHAARVFRLAADRVGVPNPVQLLATEVVDSLARDGETGRPTPECGVYHLSCHGATTWHAFGMAFVHEAIRTGRLAADRVPRIEAIEEASMDRPARRPAWSALDPSCYERHFGRTLPAWQAAIALALAPPR